MPLPICRLPFSPTHTYRFRRPEPQSTFHSLYDVFGNMGPRIRSHAWRRVATQEPLYQIIWWPKPLLALSTRQVLRSCTRPRTCRRVGRAMEGTRYQAGRRLYPDKVPCNIVESRSFLILEVLVAQERVVPGLT